MAGYQVYQFILSLIVFVILTGLFTFFIVWIIRLNLQLINAGTHDEKITTEYKKQQEKKPTLFGKIIDKVVLVLCCVVIFGAFAFSIAVEANGGKVCTGLPVLNVVESDSMSFVSEDNKYSYGKGYTDQFQMLDIVLTHELPAEKDLKIGDIVVYKQNDIMIIHRIVAIEEPNDKHSERHFLLQGDANKNADMFPVKYDQMKSIYKGQRIPFVGSFIKFMQSPAGWLCILLVVFAIVATPLADKKLVNAKIARLKLMGVIADESGAESNNESIAEEDSNAESRDETEFEEMVETDDETEVEQESEPTTEPVIEEETELLAEEDVCESIEIGCADEQVESADEEIVAEFAKQDNQTIVNDENNADVVATQTRPFGNFGVGKTFEQKINDGNEVLAHRYYQISDLLCSIQKCRVVRGKRFETYRTGNSGVAKLAIRGKTLNVYLSVDPNDYQNTKYKFVDVSDKKTFAHYPMRLKITSDRQLRWAKELIRDMAKQHGWSIVEPPVVEQESEEERHNKLFFAHLQGMRKPKTFEQKLAEANETLKARYEQITDYLNNIKKVSARQSKKCLTYRRGRVPVAKLVIRGKTLNLYLALNPDEFENTKYKYQNVAHRKAYKDFAMRIKLTSERQVKWSKELVDKLVEQKNLTFKQ
ncbi:MAG: hypothetical protein IKA42_05925 [Clostridia bacterium]|nr:hypothetical protein [Clostridia bacterium]